MAGLIGAETVPRPQPGVFSKAHRQVASRSGISTKSLHRLRSCSGVPGRSDFDRCCAEVKYHLSVGPGAFSERFQVVLALWTRLISISLTVLCHYGRAHCVVRRWGGGIEDLVERSVHGPPSYSRSRQIWPLDWMAAIVKTAARWTVFPLDHPSFQVHSSPSFIRPIRPRFRFWGEWFLLPFPFARQTPTSAHLLSRLLTASMDASFGELWVSLGKPYSSIFIVSS